MADPCRTPHIESRQGGISRQCAAQRRSDRSAGELCRSAARIGTCRSVVAGGSGGPIARGAHRRHRRRPPGCSRALLTHGQGINSGSGGRGIGGGGRFGRRAGRGCGDPHGSVPFWIADRAGMSPYPNRSPVSPLQIATCYPAMPQRRSPGRSSASPRCCCRLGAGGVRSQC